MEAQCFLTSTTLFIKLGCQKLNLTHLGLFSKVLENLSRLLLHAPLQDFFLPISFLSMPLSPPHSLMDGWSPLPTPPHPCFVPAVLGSYHVISFGQVSLTIFSEICDQFPNIAITPWLLSKQSFVCNFYTWRMK